MVEETSPGSANTTILGVDILEVFAGSQESYSLADSATVFGQGVVSAAGNSVSIIFVPQDAKLKELVAYINANTDSWGIQARIVRGSGEEALPDTRSDWSSTPISKPDR